MSVLLDVRDLTHVYGSGSSEFTALAGLTFDVEQGQFVSIVGPSGCGKTTLLRCASGLILPTGGQVHLEGKMIEDVPEDLALVFQDYSRSLFPWLTVEDNIDFPLRNAKLTRAERDERITASLTDVGLANAGGKHPWQLSGGMQQRVAIARALAYKPAILLMDEPFASVDAQTRADLEDLMLEVWERHQSTILFVTHDIEESIYLADRVIVLSGSPATVLDDIEIDLPRPRDQIETKALDRFVELRVEVARLIRGQIAPAETVTE